MRNTIPIFLIILSLIAPIITIVNGIKFNQRCGGFLKQAAEANSVELALQRLDIAISYVEANNLTDGYTSIFYKTESDNVGFWYQNLKTCREELVNCLESTQLEKTNVLLKVRESLTDIGEDGTILTVPNGISRYPNNGMYCFWNTLSIILMLIGFCIFDRY
jgi:hypothetical protein